MEIKGHRMSKIRWLFAAAVVIGTMAPQTSRAVPAFARQTGMECAACHVGSFGPQLTQFGRMFKLGGFTMGDNITNPLEHFSAMVYAGYTDVADKLAPGTMSPPNDRFGRDNTWTIDQASLFYGGKIYGGVGAMLQATYKDPNRSFAWDNSDIRYADTVDVGGTSLLLGVTLNNNPGVQDAWQGTPAWKFPYLSPTITSTPSYNPLILGAQAQKVIGGGVYGLWNDWVYGELSTYSGFGAGDGRLLGMMGGDTAARLNNFNPLWPFGASA